MSALSMRRGWCPGARRPMETGDGLLVRVHPPGGVLSAAQACSLADAAEVCGNGLLDVTARGNLQIRGVSETTHPAVLERLSAIGLLEDEAAEGPYRLTLTSPLAGIDPGARFDTAALAGGDRKGRRSIFPCRRSSTSRWTAGAPSGSSPGRTSGSRPRATAWLSGSRQGRSTSGMGLFRWPTRRRRWLEPSTVSPAIAAPHAG